MGCKMSTLRKKALAAGVSDADMDEATDAEDPKAAMVALLLGRVAAAPVARAKVVGGTATLSSSSPAKASVVGTAARPAKPAAVSASPARRLNGPSPPPVPPVPPPVPKCQGHILISYQWGSQHVADFVRSRLEESGFPCWMDVNAQRGVKPPQLIDSMAHAVQDSAGVVCLMNGAYQSSENCKSELTYARELKIPIFPVILDDDGGGGAGGGGGGEEAEWRASDWLGLVTAGALYTRLQGAAAARGASDGGADDAVSKAKLEAGVAELIGAIETHLATKSPPPPVAATGSVAAAEKAMEIVTRKAELEGAPTNERRSLPFPLPFLVCFSAILCGSTAHSQRTLGAVMIMQPAWRPRHSSSRAHVQRLRAAALPRLSLPSAPRQRPRQGRPCAPRA
eukprot:SAG22_NODE_926_length_6466_cov_55.877179_3_plen_396_part_00